MSVNGELSVKGVADNHDLVENLDQGLGDIDREMLGSNQVRVGCANVIASDLYGLSVSLQDNCSRTKYGGQSELELGDWTSIIVYGYSEDVQLSITMCCCCEMPVEVRMRYAQYIEDK